jgi:Ca2+-transporting ATPase
MVTGDHPGTAATIAEEVGLSADTVLTGADLRRDGMPLDPLLSHVYARVEPGQKLALAETLQARHHVVAVTGDGVNDAPALRQADIGVSMGLSGSDVAREASDMVVTDDNLATIVAAIREGRAIFDNIRKVVDYLVAGNLAEIAVVVTALLLVPELGVPLLPLQLLWINLVTDGLPAIALGVDDADADVMDRPPRPRGARLLSGPRLAVLSGRGGLIAIAALAGLAIERRYLDGSWDDARTIAFCTLMTAQILYAYVARLPTRGLLSNRWLAAAVAIGFVLQAVVVVWPPAQDLFGTRPLDAREWGLVLLCGGVSVLAMRLIPGLTARR